MVLLFLWRKHFKRLDCGKRIRKLVRRAAQRLRGNILNACESQNDTCSATGAHAVPSGSRLKADLCSTELRLNFVSNGALMELNGNKRFLSRRTTLGDC